METDILLSVHFSLAEMTHSPTADRLGFDEQHEPNQTVIDNLTALAVNILDPLRISLNGPIIVNSGYRCKKLNQAIGGSSTSQHVLGQAADIESHQVSNREIFDRIVSLKLPFDQLIAEYPDKHGEPAWIHVSYSSRNRRQKLKAVRVKGKTHYEVIA